MERNCLIDSSLTMKESYGEHCIFSRNETEAIVRIDSNTPVTPVLVLSDLSGFLLTVYAVENCSIDRRVSLCDILLQLLPASKSVLNMFCARNVRARKIAFKPSGFKISCNF